MKNDNFWSTSDFYSAVIVRANGIPLVRLSNGGNRFVTFHFNSSSEICEKILKNHWDRLLKIETRLFVETISELKTRIQEKLKEGRQDV